MLIEVTILVPLSAGIERDWRRAEDRALALFGGFSWVPNEVRGAWADDEGLRHDDATHRLSIAVDSLGDLALVVAFAREVGAMYGQQSMYVSALGVSECVEVGQ